MCVICYKPGDVNVAKDVLWECYDWNDDGAGFAYATPDGIVVDKGYFNFKAFWKAISKHQGKDLLMHFRIKSHGEISVKNCHPFFVRSASFPHFTFAIAHNGQLPWRSDEKMSDTMCFINDIIKPQLDRDPWFFDFLPGQALVRRTIGDKNKIAIMRHDKETNTVTHYIINREAGKDDLGCWFSNESYKKKIINFGVGTGAVTGYTPLEQATAYQFGELYVSGWKMEQDGTWTPPTYIGGHQSPFDRILARYPELINMPKQGGINGTGANNAPIVLGHRNDYDAMAEEDWKNDANRRYYEGMLGASDPAPSEDEAPRERRSAPSAVHLAHLNTEQKKILRRLAADYCRNTISDLKGWTNAEMVTWFRHDIRVTFGDAVKQMTDADLDKFIVEKNEEFIDDSGDISKPEHDIINSDGL